MGGGFDAGSTTLDVDAGGVNGPTPYTLFMTEATGAVAMCGVAVDKTHVYWGMNGGGLMRRRLDGITEAEEVGKWNYTLRGLQIAVDQDYAYWVDGSEWVRGPKAGGTPVRIQLEGPGGDVAADEKYAYAAAVGCALVVRAAHGTTTTETLYPPEPIERVPGLTYLQLDGSDVYCGSGKYVFVSRNWGPMEELTSSMNEVVGVVVVDGEPYWLDVVDRTSSTLYRRTKDGQVVAIATNGVTVAHRPVADPERKRILFTNSLAVLSMSTDTGAWKFLTKSTFPGTGCARDDKYFYWGRATPDYASIERMPLTQE